MPLRMRQGSVASATGCLIPLSTARPLPLSRAAASLRMGRRGAPRAQIIWFPCEAVGALSHPISRPASLGLPDVVILASVWTHPWVVYCKPNVQGTEAVLRYFAWYVHRVTITDSRLVALTGTAEGQVTFRYKDRRGSSIFSTRISVNCSVGKGAPFARAPGGPPARHVVLRQKLRNRVARPGLLRGQPQARPQQIPGLTTLGAHQCASRIRSLRSCASVRPHQRHPSSLSRIRSLDVFRVPELQVNSSGTLRSRSQYSLRWILPPPGAGRARWRSSQRPQRATLGDAPHAPLRQSTSRWDCQIPLVQINAAMQHRLLLRVSCLTLAEWLSLRHCQFTGLDAAVDHPRATTDSPCSPRRLSSSVMRTTSVRAIQLEGFNNCTCTTCSCVVPAGPVNGIELEGNASLSIRSRPSDNGSQRKESPTLQYSRSFRLSFWRKAPPGQKNRSFDLDL